MTESSIVIAAVVAPQPMVVSTPDENVSAGGCNGMAVLATTPSDHGGRTIDSPSSLDVVAVETIGESMPPPSGRVTPETTLGE